jgi:hypothetical protein
MAISALRSKVTKVEVVVGEQYDADAHKVVDHDVLQGERLGQRRGRLTATAPTWRGRRR